MDATRTGGPLGPGTRVPPGSCALFGRTSEAPLRPDELHRTGSGPPAAEPTVRGLATLGETLAALSCPGAYPWPVPRVERIETHMSCVFLAGRWAFKLKKPVRHEMLDFHTLAARHRACRDEVRLNRRLAPDVYLAAVPLVREPDGRLAVEGRGEIVDWLVRMRRLPRSRMLNRLIARGGPTGREAARIATRLAAFFDRADRLTIEADEQRARFANELRKSRRVLARAPFAERAGALCDALGGFLEGHAGLVDARVAAGRLVDGHGDLRAEHVVVLRERVVVIDCVEFCGALRANDPVDELAFLGLDCERLGAPHVGPVLIDAWTGLTGDRPPAELLDFYRALRAVVRARLAVGHLEDPVVRDPSRWITQADACLGLAERHAPR